LAQTQVARVLAVILSGGPSLSRDVWDRIRTG